MGIISTFQQIFWIAALFLAIITVSGCDQVNKENYAKLEAGMPFGDVVEILGDPRNCNSVLTAKNCVWGKDPKTISVQLVADKVVLYTYTGL